MQNQQWYRFTNKQFQHLEDLAIPSERKIAPAVLLTEEQAMKIVLWFSRSDLAIQKGIIKRIRDTTRSAKIIALCTVSENGKKENSLYLQR